LGVWDRLESAPAPIRRLAVAEGAPPSGLAARRRPPFELSWDSADTPMGYVVGNAALHAALAAAAQDRQVDMRQECALSSRRYLGDNTEIELLGHDGRTEQRRAGLIIACDGANSRLAEDAGLAAREERRTQTAIVAVLEAQAHHDDTAYQRFLPGGPFALMPMDGHRMSLVWTLADAEAERLLAADTPHFEQACLDAFGSSLGYLKLVGTRLGWPLRPSWRPKITAPGLVLAGDAAHAIHPLAGQGYNLALADAAVLADLVAGALSRGLPTSHPSVRNGYETARRRERMAMTMATSGLNRLFADMPGGLRRLAGLGFSVLDRLPAKSLFSDIARGGRLAEAELLDGRLPRRGGFV
ncbi:MAG: FAD-dependent monooxygenase, partial [Pseudomonadota bacterium]|nr:FAD-dependent monooxygenase [Pseudomonadota bacterium]